MNNLATTYSALGRHADALAMKERVLDFVRRVLQMAPSQGVDVVMRERWGCTASLELAHWRWMQHCGLRAFPSWGLIASEFL